MKIALTLSFVGVIAIAFCEPPPQVGFGYQNNQQGSQFNSNQNQQQYLPPQNQNQNQIQYGPPQQSQGYEIEKAVLFGPQTENLTPQFASQSYQQNAQSGPQNTQQYFQQAIQNSFPVNQQNTQQTAQFKPINNNQPSQEYGLPGRQPSFQQRPPQGPQAFQPQNTQPQSQSPQYSPPPQTSRPNNNQQYAPPISQNSAEIVNTQPTQYGPPNGQQQQQQKGQNNNSPQYGPPGYSPGQPLSAAQPQAGAQSQCPPNDPVANKELVKRAYQSAIGDHIYTNLEKDWATDYIQHNPYVADGLEAFRNYIKELSETEPAGKIDFQRVAADGDLVWLHVRVPLFGKVMAIVDIFRIQCGKIQEHWDVIQDTTLETPSQNPHPFF